MNCLRRAGIIPPTTSDTAPSEPICRPYRTPALTRGTRSGRHVPVEPGHEPGQVISDGREPADAVSFPWVDHQFRVDAMTDQCLVELSGLAGRRAPVLRARREQGRRPGLARVHNRTACVQLVAGGPPRCSWRL